MILISLFMLMHFPSNVLLSGNISLRSWGGYLFPCKKRTGQVRRGEGFLASLCQWDGCVSDAGRTYLLCMGMVPPALDPGSGGERALG